MRAFWIMGMHPKSSDKCLYRRQQGRHRKKRRPYEHKCRDWGEVTTNQGNPEPRAGRDQEGLPTTVFGGGMALQTCSF